jgi:hypothetical protein|tara:strand:+ start:483 stop:1160 length:678 start_codon:yes stop_codon:yes gene_type:complete
LKLTIEHLNKLIEKYPDNFVIIFFKGGMAGSALCRIINSHPEFYYKQKYLNQKEYNDPLKFPDSVEGFNVQDHGWLGFKEQHLSCVHLSFYTPWSNSKTQDYIAYGESVTEYLDLVSKNYKVALKTHKFSLIGRFNKSKRIVLEGNNLNRGFDHLKNMNYKVEDYSKEDVIRFDIQKLMSPEYDIFLEAYIKLVQELDLTPKVNSVRSFILMWLERQERFKRTLS